MFCKYVVCAVRSVLHEPPWLRAWYKDGCMRKLRVNGWLESGIVEFHVRNFNGVFAGCYKRSCFSGLTPSDQRFGGICVSEMLLSANSAKERQTLYHKLNTHRGENFTTLKSLSRSNKTVVLEV